MATLREQNLKLKGIIKKNQRPRSSITDPYEKFWPLLDPDNSKILVAAMEKTIYKENGKLKINWFTLKKLPPDVRKCQIKDLSKKHKIISPNLKIQRSILKMGINETSRHIEKDMLTCCLIAEDVADSMLTKHLLFMTAAKKIPVLILPDLRSITKRIIGFSSAVLGIKNEVLNKVDSPLYNLYKIVIELSIKFKNPHIKQIASKELKVADNPIKLDISIENYLLKKLREGRAFVPGGISKSQTSNDLSFIPIEKMIIKEQKPFEQDEELIEISTSTDLFSIDTKPLNIEDIGESVERKTFQAPLRYHGLKMKKMNPNPKRKLKKEENSITKKKK